MASPSNGFPPPAFGRAGLNQVSKYVLELSRKLTIDSVPGGSLAFTVLSKPWG
jgi:hypothetical protein